MAQEYDYSSDAASPESAPKSEGKEISRLDALREALETKIERAPRLIEIPERPGVAILVSPNISQKELRKWRKDAGEGAKNREFDITLFSCLVIAHTNIGLFLHGKEVFDDDDNPLTFASPFVKEFLDVERPFPEGVKAMFGLDPHLEAAAVSILEAAGYGEDVDSSDPFTDS